MTEKINAILEVEKCITEKGNKGLKIFMKMNPKDEEWITFYQSEFEIDKMYEILHTERG